MRRRITFKQQDTQLLQSQHLPLDEIASFTMMPAETKAQIMISAPHGGICYPNDALSLDETHLMKFRSLEDTATSLIATSLHNDSRPVILANLARGIIDLNRPSNALDPAMYDGDVKSITTSQDYAPYVTAGYGVMPRLSAQRQALYDEKLPLSFARELASRFYTPYHDMLAETLSSAKDGCLLVDIHSMPDNTSSKPLPDFVFGDDHGVTLPHQYRAIIDAFMKDTDYSFGWNYPYAGGYITRHYGHRTGRHYSLQIEINRALYCTNNHRYSPHAIREITGLLEALISHLEASMASVMAAQ